MRINIKSNKDDKRTLEKIALYDRRTNMPVIFQLQNRLQTVFKLFIEHAGDYHDEPEEGQENTRVQIRGCEKNQN